MGISSTTFGEGKKSPGRAPGSQNKVTRTAREIYLPIAEEAAEKAKEVLLDTKHPAWGIVYKEANNRAYGQAPQSIEQHNTGKLVIEVKRMDAQAVQGDGDEGDE